VSDLSPPMNRSLILPWLLLVFVSALLLYVVIDNSITINHQRQDLVRSKHQSKALLLLAQKESVGSSYERVKTS
jgi:lipopolysaccharide export LptBFGC system permease protein LptF